MPVSSKQIARSKAKQRAQQQARNSIVIIIAVVAVVFVVLIVAVASQVSSSGKADQGSYAGIAQSTTDDGAAILGDPKAKIAIMEVADFSCPHCAEYHPTILQLIDQYVKTGKTKFIYRPVTFVGQQLSDVAAQAALCAGKQGAFWPMQDALYNIAQTSGPQAFAITTLVDKATSLKLDSATFSKCLTGGETESTIRSTADLASQIGANSTPSMLYSTDDGKTWQWWLDSTNQDVHGGVPLQAIGDTIEKANSGTSG